MYCDTNNCDANATCTADIAERVEGGHNCDANAACTSTIGGWICAFSTGYEGDGGGCVDIDECLASPCHAVGNCSNNAVSYTCACNDGFNGDGKICTDINECLNDDACHADATCTNSHGSCACNDGYSDDGMNCADNDECALETDKCDVNATCATLAGPSYFVGPSTFVNPSCGPFTFDLTQKLYCTYHTN